MMKFKLLILFLLGFTSLWSQAPLNFSSRLNITNVSGSDPYTLVGVIQDDLGLWSASDLNVSQDSIYHLEGSDLLIYRITSITSASGNNFTIVVDDIMDSGILPSTGNEWAAMAFTTNFQFPMEIGNLATNFKATIDNRFKQRLDAALQAAGGGGGATNLAISGTSSPLTLTSSTGTDVTFTAGTNVTLSGTASNVTINSTNPGGDLTAITTSQPTQLVITSGTGPIPNIDIGTIAVGNGGTGSNTQNFWDLTTDQVSAGVKRTSGGLIVGSTGPLTGQTFGTTTAGLVGIKGGTSGFTAESVYQNFNGTVIESGILVAGTQRTRIIATGSDTDTRASVIDMSVRAPGASRDVGIGLTLSAYSPNPLEHYAQLFIDEASAYATDAAITIPARGIAWESTPGIPDYSLTQQAPLGLQVREDGILVDWIDVGQPGWANGSDSTLKKNIVEIDLTPAQILGFKAYTFDWKYSDSTDLGVIAQDFMNDTTLAKILRGTDTLLGVSSTGLAALALEAASDLQGQVNVITGKEAVLSEVSLSTTATNAKILPINSTLSARTITPPSTPAAGDWFAVSDSRGTANTNNITIDFVTSTQKLHGASANYVINTNTGFAKFTYVDDTVGWVKSN